MDPTNLSAAALAEAIRRRALSPVEAVEAALQRIEDGARLNAFITVAADQALAEARRAEAALLRGDPVGPLHGVPLSVKDLTSTAGIRTTLGSPLFAELVPNEDAVAVARARQAGAIVIGKTTTPAFGHKPFTDGQLFGRTLHPLDESVTCGGSSGGAAVAVAAFMGPLALGTDGGGSIRIPAACCGVVGLKPTLGAVPNLQAPDLFSANSYVGPIARSVGDAALLFRAIAGPDTRDPYGQAAAAGASPLRRIGLLMRGGNRLLDPEVEQAVEHAARQLAALGCSVEPVALDFAALEPAFLVILQSLLAARLGDHLRRTPELLDPSLRVTIERGLSHDAVALHKASFARTACFQQLQGVLAKVDAILSPTLAAPALPVDTDPHGSVTIADEPAGTIRGAWYPYTYPINLTGHPAISLPCGRTRAGLPIGAQLIARWHADDALLELAGRLEQALA